MKPILVLNLKGTINCPADIRKTLELLKIERKYNATIVEQREEIVGMLRKAKDYIAWCEADKETISLLLEKRAMLSKRRKLGAEELRKLGFKDYGELAEKIFEHGRDALPEQIKPFFRLRPPLHGFPKPVRKQYNNKGFSGYNPELLEVVRRMV